MKAEAILSSSFDEILYLDSDNYPLSDVTPLFDDKRLTELAESADRDDAHSDLAVGENLDTPREKELR